MLPMLLVTDLQPAGGFSLPGHVLCGCPGPGMLLLLLQGTVLIQVQGCCLSYWHALQ
jgi:hypothetical protein